MLPSRVFPSQGYSSLTPSVPQVSTSTMPQSPSIRVSTPMSSSQYPDAQYPSAPYPSVPYPMPSAPYSMPSAPYSMPSAPYPVPSAPYPVRSAPYPIPSSQESRGLQTKPYRVPRNTPESEILDELQEEPTHSWRILPDVKPPLYCVEDKIVYPGGPELTRQICAFFTILGGN